MKRPKFIERGPITLEASIEDFKSEMESLKEEIESWKDNLEGNSMEHLPKYEEVSECYDELEGLENHDLDVPEGISAEFSWVEPNLKKKTSRAARASDAACDLRRVSELLLSMLEQSTLMKEERKAELEELARNMEEVANDAENISFPGMF